jgi:hypothetical protein
MLRRGKRAQAAVTFDADHVPQSECQKCRRPGRISSCERKGSWEEYTFICESCRHRWLIAL